MSKGRRAADRRREREKSHGLADAPDGLTNPGLAEGTASARAATAIGPAWEADPEQEFAEALTGDAGLSEVAEVTAVRERPTAEPKRGGRVVVRAGPDAGAVVVLSRTPALVGRGAAALVQLTDPKVSRAHLELRYLAEDGLWLVEDQGSRSGTLLNGALLESPAEIQHGDLLHVGESELRFLWHDALPEARADEPEEQTGTRTRPAAAFDEPTQTIRRAPGSEAREGGQRPSSIVVAALVGAALLVLTGAVVGGYFAFFHQRSDQAQIQLQVETLLSDARRLLGELKLEDARSRLETVLALKPGDPDAQSLLRMVDSEGKARAALEEARRLFDEGRHDEARKALMRIPDASGFAHGRDRLRAAIGEAERTASLRLIEGLIDEGKLDEAMALLAQHLERWPKDEAARALELRIEKKRGAQPAEHPAVIAARRAFRDGNLAKARVLVEAESTRGTRSAQRYLADLDTFEAALQKGERHLQVMNPRGARPALERAFGLLGRLGGKGSRVMERRVQKPLSNALYLDAMGKQQRGDECGWAQDILKAYDANGADSKVKAQKRAVDSKAKQGLLRARAAASDNPERGRQIAREHLCFAPALSSTGKALRKMLR